MKQSFRFLESVLVFVVLSMTTAKAQNSWAMAVVEDGGNIPSFMEYHCQPEKGNNGMEYLRIYDESSRMFDRHESPKKLQYGYRMSDKKVYIYDYVASEEHIALDFTLSAGDRFVTYNGMEWEVEAAADTLVKCSFRGEPCTKRLLKVRSTDGKYTDQWLEDFGSFTNHFMILPMDKSQRVCTLWMENDFGNYIIREISSEPIYCHFSELPQKNNGTGKEYTNCTYDNGNLKVEYERLCTPRREYYCFYRKGDALYCAYEWDLNPVYEETILYYRKDTAFFTGLPVPESGEYALYFHEKEDAGASTSINNASRTAMSENSVYDLQGRKLQAQPSAGIYVKKGKKVLVK